MDRRIKLALIGITAAIIIILVGLVTMVIDKMTPSKETMPLTDYIKVGETEVLVILQDDEYEKKGMLLDGMVYIDIKTIVQEFNHRFYWDYKENVLTYTTPNEILQTEAGSSKYSITKSMIKTDVDAEYKIAMVFGDEVYLALDFVKEYSDLNYKLFESPNRVVINYRPGEYLYTEVTKMTQLRSDANIKSPIVVQLPVGTSLIYVDTEEAPKKGFVKVMTDDGVKGYVREKHIKQAFYKTISSTYKKPEYTAQVRTGKVNMVFHQVFNESAADNIENLIKATKEVTVISPTWFSIKDVSGNISSLATTRYVEKAKELGLEVWALVDDFNMEINMKELLSHTSRRETLSNALVEAALQYKLNGINIDFEKVPSDAGEDYIQFLRELSVKCRNNGIVLSVDSYVPTPYTAYYDREEQGKIVDYVVVMAYDEHYAGSDVAGPVASLPFVSEAVSNIITMVPKEKVIIAIPFYTRLWKETEDGEVSSDSLSMTPAANLITENDIKAEWDDTYGCYYIEYQRDGATYRMWQEEEESIEAKMKVIYGADVAGVAAWKLGLEKESIWNVIIRYLH